HAVDADVGGAQVVDVGAGAGGGAEAAVGLGPHVLAVPVAAVPAVEGLAAGDARVQQDHVAAVGRVLVGDLQGVPDRRVRQLGLDADDLFQGDLEGVTGLAVGVVVVRVVVCDG